MVMVAATVDFPPFQFTSTSSTINPATLSARNLMKAVCRRVKAPILANFKFLYSL